MKTQSKNVMAGRAMAAREVPKKLRELRELLKRIKRIGPERVAQEMEARRRKQK